MAGALKILFLLCLCTLDCSVALDNNNATCNNVCQEKNDKKMQLAITSYFPAISYAHTADAAISMAAILPPVMHTANAPVRLHEPPPNCGLCAHGQD